MKEEKDNTTDEILNSNKDEEQEKTLMKSILLPKLSFIQIIPKVLRMQITFEWIMRHLMTFLLDVIELYFPFIEGNMINAITSEKDFSSLMYWVKIKVLIHIIEYIMHKFKSFLDGKLDTYGDFKKIYMERVLNKDMEFFDNYKPSSLKVIMDDDIYSFAYFDLSQMFYILRILLKIFVGFFSIIFISYELFFLQILFCAYDFYLNSLSLESSWDNYYSLLAKRDEVFEESFLNIKLIKCFSVEHKILKYFKICVDNIMNLNIKNESNSFQDEKQIMQKGFSLIGMLYVGNLFIKGKIGLGDFTKFSVNAEKVNQQILHLISETRQMKINFNKLQNLYSVIEYQPRIQSIKKGVKKNEIQDKNKFDFNGEIEFRNVNFRYPIRPEAQILRNLSFKISQGEVAAFVGSSGSGKSTVAALFHRLYDPENGEVRINNNNLKDIDLELFHSKIGYVSQEPCLFTLSIKENILFGVDRSNLTEEDNKKLDLKLDDVIQKANCGFIHDKSIFPNGLNTIVSEGSLSGGQKQRIAIARALMKEVNFLVFDEATSALDANSEHEVQKAIDEIIKEAKITTIIIAHRLSTIKNCSKIFVLNKGTIVEEGTHKELKRKNGFYTELIKKQMEAFEKDEQEILLKKKSSLINQ